MTFLTRPHADHVADQTHEISRAVRRLRKRMRKEMRKLRRDPVQQMRKRPVATGAALAGAAGLAAAAVLLINRATRRR